MAEEPDQKPESRRTFFLEALAGIIAPAIDLVQQRLQLDRLRQLSEAGEPNGPALRPPGAAPGELFTRLCTRCGQCAKACPAGAIVLDPFPRIEPDRQPCVLCEKLPCMAACESSALQKLPREQIVMGLAAWDPSLCRLTQGAACDACVRVCSPGALRLEAGAVCVDGMKCAGCGVCQFACPARPRAITVHPF